ncbi:MAG: Ni/Fe hydrogenase subunit alpha [Candidatus Odinarchaeota archaeon]|nr:Ni/Fe hydrogenase subunit alpha [Candidatus Odinarchaeota archaeon]
MKEFIIRDVSRVVGHIGLDVLIDGSEVSTKFRVFNDPRFIERLVLGKRYEEIPYITSRICGPCSVSHTITPLIALEKAIGLDVSEDVDKMRELLICGEIIENHVVYLYLLALPDYLGYRDSVELSKKEPELLRNALKLRAASIELIRSIVGRNVHPNSYKIGSMRYPSYGRIEYLKKKLMEVRNFAVKTAELFMGIDYPEINLEQDRGVSVYGNGEYPVLGDKILSSDGHLIPSSEYDEFIKESVVRYSTSKVTYLDGKPFHAGSRARLNLFWKGMTEEAREYASKLKIPLKNPYENVVAKGIEVLHFLDRALEILSSIDPSYAGKIIRSEYVIRDGEGVGTTEAPRGLLIHHYVVDEEGRVVYGNVITPTAMNARHLEVSSKVLVEMALEDGLKDERIKFELERLARSYDPCLGCATHTIEVNIRRK